MTGQSSTQNDLFNLDLIRSYVDKELNPRFVERDWLKRQVEGKLADSACRFVLLTAEPGAGKSAFMAWMANQHPDWCRYFIRRDQRTPLGDVGSYSFLLQVGFQLAATYPDLFKQEQIKIVVEQRIGTATNSEIVGAEIGKMFASPFYEKVIQIQQQVTHSKDNNVTGVRIGEFYATERDLPIENLQFMALFDPAKAMMKQMQEAVEHPHRQIVVLVDALDELRYQDSELSLLKWLTSCPELPANLRFVLTCRPDDDLLRAFRGSQQGRIQEISIAEEDPDVEKDLTLYTRFLIETPEVNQTLIEMQQDLDVFTDQAVTKANGNFGYLGAIGRAVDEAIRQNEDQLLREILKLSELPDTLQDLYAFFLSKIKDAVAKEKVPVEDAEGEIGFMPVWSAVYKPILGILSVALEPLTPTQIQKLGLIQAEFDYVTEAIERLQQFLDQLGNCYRLYHSTLPEFFTSPKTKERKDYAYCYVDAIKQNQRVVNYYQAGKKIWAEVDLNQIAEDDYGRRHLAQHLVKADRAEELHTLLWLDKDGKNAWFKVKDDEGDTDGFLEDLDLASNTAASEALKQIEAGEVPGAIALSARYRLLRSTIGDIAHSNTPELVIRALELGLWGPSRAISVARQTPLVLDRVERYRLLLASSAMVEPYRSQVEKLACDAIEAWQDLPAYPLVALSEHLSEAARETVLQKALEAAIQYPETREKSSQARKAIGIQDYYSAARESAHALAAVTARFAGQLREVATQQGLTFVNQISVPKEKAHALGAWLHLLPDSQKHGKLQEALVAAHAIDNQQEKIFALAAIAGGLNDDEKIDVLEMAWQLSEDISDEPWRAFCLSRVAPQLKGDKRRTSLDLGLRNLETERGWTLIRSCAPTFVPSESSDVLAVIKNISDRNKRVEMLIELGFAINRDDIEFAVRDAIAENDPWSRNQKLAKLSPQLPADLLQKALELSLLTVSPQEEEEEEALDQIAYLLPQAEQNKASSNGEEVSRMLIWEHNFRYTSLYKPLWEYGSVHSLISVSDNLSQEPTDITPEEQETALQTELERVTQITDESLVWAAGKEKAYALEHLIPRLINPNHLEEALSIARKIPGGWYRSQPLLALAMRFESNRREQILQEAVDAVLEPGSANGDRRAAVIEQMVSVLTIPLLKKVLDGVQMFDEWGRIRALKAIFPRIETELMSPALEAIRVLSNDDSKRELIELMANKLTGDWVALVVEISEDITDEEQRTAVLEVIAPIAQANDRETILRMKESLSSAAYRARVLAKLLLPEPNSKQLLRLIRREILEHLEHGAFTSRLEVLQFLSIKYIFTEPILDCETLSRIIYACQQICQRWRWG